MPVKNFFNRLKFWKRTRAEPVVQSEEERLANSLRHYESYVFKTQNILMWENPSVSILSVIIINIIFWLLSTLEWRLYGILCTGILIFTIHEAWVQQIWPEIKVPDDKGPDEKEQSPVHPSVLAVSRFVTSLNNMTKEYFFKLRALRIQHPTMFSSGLSIVLGMLMLLGEMVSGLTIVYLTTMAVMIVPGVVMHWMSPEMKSTVCSSINMAHTAFQAFVSGDDSDDEYLPQTSSEDMLILTKVSDLTNEMQRSEDSFTPKGSTDPVSGLSYMPSHEEGSLDSLAALSDFEPSLDPTGEHGEDSDSASEDVQHIQFQSGHFNGDSSSSGSDEEDKAFTKDLVFSEVDHSKPTEKTLASIFTQAITSNIMGNVGKGLLANVIGLSTTSSTPATTPSSRLDSDSDPDYDFEIINKDELNTEQS